MVWNVIKHDPLDFWDVQMNVCIVVDRNYRMTVDSFSIGLSPEFHAEFSVNVFNVVEAARVESN